MLAPGAIVMTSFLEGGKGEEGGSGPQIGQVEVIDELVPGRLEGELQQRRRWGVQEW